jgi:hypothetical protein
MPGKQAEAVAVVKEIVAHYNRIWPLAVPRQVLVDITGEAGRVHIVTTKESLAEHERQLAEQHADETIQALGQRLDALLVPGSERQTLQRLA